MSVKLNNYNVFLRSGYSAAHVQPPNAQSPKPIPLSEEKIPLSEFNEVVLNLLGLRHVPNMEHCYGVALYAEALAKDLKLEENQQEVVKTAGLLHDIGKINYLDRAFLTAPNERERKVYRKHPLQGEKLFEKVGVLKKYGIPEIIGQHHKHNDGSGFPRRLKDEDIRIETKIL